MKSNATSVALIGYQDQGNLGLGYLAAVLMQQGYEVSLIDFRVGEEGILERIRRQKPAIVGFSLIFQYFLPRFIRLVRYLRKRAITSHFTVGGHYPSLRYDEIMKQMPDLDSVVLFEGEYTLLALADCLESGDDWRQVEGIAYRDGDKIICNPLRSLISDLDLLPFPCRTFAESEILGQTVYPLIATRGCPRKCAFCSIREFYAQAPGKLVRRRSPSNVVAEMAARHETDNATIFLFQDDDFPLLGHAGRSWVRGFIRELDKRELTGKILWKISCRVDELDVALLADMQQAGLYLVYLGIESGNETGLELLNKEVRVADNLEAVDLLKRLGLMFAYGFMMFDPSSTFASVQQNVAFLRAIVGDGSSPVVFCKMLPYAGTAIEQTLRDAGRLSGSIAQPDYHFLDYNLDRYYLELNAALAGWTHGDDSLSSILNLLLHELSVIKRLFPPLAGAREYGNFLSEVTKKSNEYILNLIEESADGYRLNHSYDFPVRELADKSCSLVKELVNRRDAFILRNQTVMLKQNNMSRRCASN